MQENIEATEARAKNEINSLRKKYQVETEELRAKYELSKRQVADAENNAKRIQQAYKVCFEKKKVFFD